MGTEAAILTTLLFYLINSLGFTSEEVNTILLKKKWYVRTYRVYDLRDIEAEAEKAIENVSWP
jgi:acetate kinase